MKPFHPILALAVLFIAGCNQDEDAADATKTSLDSHQEAIAKFQDGQKRFKESIATVRDEKSFDSARADLDGIVSDWRDVATALRALKPPSEDEQARFRGLIAEGHRRTEPTGEDMISLVSIESRETEVTQWLEEFVAAAGEAGIEMVRLYGPIESAGSEGKALELDLSTATFNGLPIDQALKNPPVFIRQNQEAAGAGQPPTRSDSK